ncbi:MAG: hypothetical protein IPP36_06225 [Nitrosomonadales bacterium]|nr:hypothetical protein [Nitrosomonadales bacterium]
MAKSLRDMKVSQEPQTAIYFAHPYRSWGELNENSNGLLRQCIPQRHGTDRHHRRTSAEAENGSTTDLEKYSGFKTPHEVFFGVEFRYTGNHRLLHFGT